MARQFIADYHIEMYMAVCSPFVFDASARRAHRSKYRVASPIQKPANCTSSATPTRVGGLPHKYWQTSRALPPLRCVRPSIRNWTVRAIDLVCTQSETIFSMACWISAIFIWCNNGSNSYRIESKLLYNNLDISESTRCTDAAHILYANVYTAPQTHCARTATPRGLVWAPYRVDGVLSCACLPETRTDRHMRECGWWARLLSGRCEMDCHTVSARKWACTHVLAKTQI